MKKLIGVVFGGYSGEAEISRKSAKMILDNIDHTQYEVIGISLDKSGFHAILENETAKIDLNDFSYETKGGLRRPDICLIIVHGPPGEDGKLQGYFDLINMPYSTGSVLNTALTFNKASTNSILKQLGYNSARGKLFKSLNKNTATQIEGEFNFPIIVKPNEGGSSLGISKVSNTAELPIALKTAFEHGTEVLVEEFIEGREYSCGVITTNSGPKALAITEIKTEKAFFDYKAKYEYDQTQEITPADLPHELYQKCQKTSEEIYNAFNCRGVVRIDYRLKGEDFFVIEINSVPGMSEKSIVPQQAAHEGISKKELISIMIESADFSRS